LDIKLFHNKDIDLKKWDQVIMNSSNSRIYALSWFLSILNPDWHGLIVENYDYVMPVILSKKFGVKYIYQPIYAQQLGVFPHSNEVIISKIFRFLEQEYKFIDISLNSGNQVSLENVQTVDRKNYLLPLDKEYSQILKGYSYLCKRNLKKAAKLNHVFSNIALEDFFHFVESNEQLKIVKKTLPTLKRIITVSCENSSGITYGAYSDDGNLSGVAFFLTDGKRYIYLYSFSSKTGKKNKSMFSIIDSFIREHSDQKQILDFEGSNIPGIAFFFGGFGALPEIYQHVKYNRLPFFIRVFKK
jgi:hypothetical protein